MRNFSRSATHSVLEVLGNWNCLSHEWRVLAAFRVDTTPMDPMQLLGVIQQVQQQVQQQMQQLMQQLMRQQQQGAPQNAGNERQSQQLILKGFDAVKTFSGGEEQWQNWSWKVTTAVSGMCGERAEMLAAAETTAIGNTEEILGEDQFVDANQERCRKSSREIHSVLARYTSSEALTIVTSVATKDGVGAWARLNANHSRRTLGRMFRVQRECMYPKPAKDVGQVRLAIMQWEDKWKSMMSVEDVGVAGKFVRKDMREQMLMRLDEIGENYERTSRRKWYPTRRTRPNRHEDARRRRRYRWSSIT